MGQKWYAQEKEDNNKMNLQKYVSVKKNNANNNCVELSMNPSCLRSIL